ncbi:MAG: hypothetical protein WCH46_03265 [bacterium]
MAKKVVLVFALLLGFFAFAETSWAQQSGGQDSTGEGLPPLRARRDAYIIETYPSPARHGQILKIKIYSHFAQQISVRIVDVNDRPMKVLQEPVMVSEGIHTYEFPTNLVATGPYYVRLTTYSSTGSENLIQDSRFLVLH